MTMKLTPNQERVLRMIFAYDPDNVKYSDVLLADGNGRNPTYRILKSYGLIEYTHIAGNSFRAALTIKGVLYLHGEESADSSQTT